MNTQSDGKVRVAAIGDIHVQEHGGDAYREFFEEVSREAEVLLLCGDLTNIGLPREAEHLAEDLKSCRIPVLAVLGNHDYERGQPEEIRKIVSAAGVVFLDEETFSLRKVGFAGVKGFAGGFEKHMLTSFGEGAIKHFVQEAVSEALRLETQLQTLTTQRRVVLLHYAPICTTLQGEPLEVYPFLGCSRLAETIDRFDVTAVFHGHSHLGSPEGKTPKGAAVYNCCSEVLARLTPPRRYLLMEL